MPACYTHGTLTGERTFTALVYMDKKRHLKAIQRFYRRYKRMPSYSEIMRLAGYKSKNAAFKLVKSLIALKLLGKDSQGKIIPGSRFQAIQLLGTIEAGWPSPAEEELLDTMSLDEYLIRNREATFLLNVTGRSMVDAGILPGDQVLVERGVEPKNGDIVIAEIDGQWTMKYLKKKGKQVVLMPANKKYKPIRPKQELDIAAVVKAVIRKY